MSHYHIFSINPGSTSTKIALFEDQKELFRTTVTHNASQLALFPTIPDQFAFRRDTILSALDASRISLEGVDAFVGRGGGLVSCEGGTYEINSILLEHARTCYTVKHPAALGPVLANAFAETYGGRAFVVNPPDVDELQPVARICGLRGVYRKSRFHALNQKEVAIRLAAKLGKRYDETNLVVAHMGGGVSVTAHKHGRCIDTSDIVGGDGAYAPTRMGHVPAEDIIAMCFSGQYTEKQMREKLTKTGGVTDLLGTSDVQEVSHRSSGGDAFAALVLQGMAYQIGKEIGAYAAVLHGHVDAIALTGGMARDDNMVRIICDMCGSLAPIHIFPGEWEMEALASGALRVLTGAEQPKVYTGVPVWTDFDFPENNGSNALPACSA